MVGAVCTRGNEIVLPAPSTGRTPRRSRAGDRLQRRRSTPRHVDRRDEGACAGVASRYVTLVNPEESTLPPGSPAALRGRVPCARLLARQRRREEVSHVRELATIRPGRLSRACRRAGRPNCGTCVHLSFRRRSRLRTEEWPSARRVGLSASRLGRRQPERARRCSRTRRSGRRAVRRRSLNPVVELL